jgi:glycosyltransferase involved in cell wall biosynthesis
MRVLIISEMSVPYATGGGETRYGLLTRQLAAQGHDVTWLSMNQRQSPVAETIDGVKHRHAGPRLQQPPVRTLGQKLHYMGVVLWHLLRHRYDIVDCQPYAPLPAALLACRLRGMPMVASIHDTSSEPGQAGSGDQWLSATDRRIAKLVEGGLYRLGYDRVLTGAGSVQADLVGRFRVPADRVAVAANGVDVPTLEATPAHPQACDLIFVGRLIPHKHPEDFLRAAALLQQQREGAGLPPLRLKLVGAGPLEPAARATAEALGLLPHLLHWGEIEHHAEVVSHIRSARVLVLPSTREGFGLVLTEAMAVGTAVLAYDIPAVRETLGPTLTDALVPAGDVAALSKAMHRLLAQPAHHAAQVAAGHARVRTSFDARDFVGRVLAVYRSTLQRRSRAPR